MICGYVVEDESKSPIEKARGVDVPTSRVNDLQNEVVEIPQGNSNYADISYPFPVNVGSSSHV